MVRGVMVEVGWEVFRSIGRRVLLLVLYEEMSVEMYGMFRVLGWGLMGYDSCVCVWDMDL